MKVSLAPCNDYERENVYSAVKALLEPLGGMGRFVRPGMRVYVKPNILGKALPSASVTTHPEVVAAVARLAREAGAADVMIGDCPGGTGREDAIRQTYAVCGYDEIAKREGARLVVNTTRTVRAVPDGAVARSFELVDEMMGADVLINVAKAKTHQLCMFTGATKNLYGTVYGRDKRKYHAIYHTPTSFNQFLIDIAETVRPALSIIDAVIGLEGPGPAAGYPRKLGVLLASESTYALDAVAVKLMGWKQTDVMLLDLARKRGLLPEKLGDVEILGGDIEKLKLRKPFRKPAITAQATLRLGRLLPARLREALHARPEALAGKCVGCGECAAACPPHAIVIIEGKPAIDYGKCIRCFCCQELCPEKAMEAVKGFRRRKK